MTGVSTRLRDLINVLNWTYVALWIPSSTYPGILEWKDGWFNTHQNVMGASTSLEKLFYSAYKACQFTPGTGYVGLVQETKKDIWILGNNPICQHALLEQAQFLQTAKIQTVLCIPWFEGAGVMELGNIVPMERNEICSIQETTSKLSGDKWWQTLAEALASIGNDQFALKESDSFRIPSSSAQVPAVVPSMDPSRPKGQYSNIIQQLAPKFDQGFDYLGLAGHQRFIERIFDAGQHNLIPTTDVYSGGPLLGSSSGASKEAQLQEGERISDASIIEIPAEFSQATHGRSMDSAIQGSEAHFTESADYRTPDYRRSRFQPIQHALQQKLSITPIEIWIPWPRYRQMLRTKPVTRVSESILKRALLKIVPEMHLARNDLERAKNIHASFERVLTPPGIDAVSLRHNRAERRRREKTNELFDVLRALLHCAPKLDKLSVLSQAIQTLQRLEKRQHELGNKVSEHRRSQSTSAERISQSRDQTHIHAFSTGAPGAEASPDTPEGYRLTTTTHPETRATPSSSFADNAEQDFSNVPPGEDYIQVSALHASNTHNEMIIRLRLTIPSNQPSAAAMAQILQCINEMSLRCITTQSTAVNNSLQASFLIQMNEEQQARGAALLADVELALKAAMHSFKSA